MMYEEKFVTRMWWDHSKKVYGDLNIFVVILSSYDHRYL
jgi:hypothetical protein